MSANDKKMWLTMKLLLKIKENTPKGKYSDVLVLHINHCMDNSFYFNEILKDIFAQVVFVAAPYNRRQLEAAGKRYIFYTTKIKGDRYSLYRNNQPAGIICEGFFEAIGAMIRTAVVTDVLPWLEEGKRLLILEDGGYHYEVMRDILEKYPSVRDRIAGVVEQTTSGTRRCRHDGKRHGYMYPCVSVARSDIKMNLESIYIGRRVVEELSVFLYTANAFLEFHPVLIVGYGIVGRSVARFLSSSRCSVEVYETDARIRSTAEAEGCKIYEVVDSRMFDRDLILVGCVGKPSFGWDFIRAYMEGKADNLYLASASSQNVEFIEFLEACQSPGERFGLRIRKTGKERFFTCYQVSDRERTKNVYLLADGFPVNFYREDVVSLTYKVIDLVFAEMLILGMRLCDSVFDKKLMLLGYSEELKGSLDENQLIRQWFLENRFADGNQEIDVDRYLKPHPDRMYLRERFLGDE